jgi:hypothetical protein
MWKKYTCPLPPPLKFRLRGKNMGIPLIRGPENFLARVAVINGKKRGKMKNRFDDKQGRINN